jgi:hypothetical protein
MDGIRSAFREEERGIKKEEMNEERKEKDETNTQAES